jgi:hypothetical protein
MVPALAEEQSGFDVQRVANETADSQERTRRGAVASFTYGADLQGNATREALSRLEANARRRNADLGCEGKIFLDVSSHSRQSLREHG